MLDLMCYKNDIYCCDDEIIDNNDKYLLFEDNRSKQKIKIDKNDDCLFLSDTKNLQIIPNIGFLKKDYFLKILCLVKHPFIKWVNTIHRGSVCSQPANPQTEEH